MEFKVGDNVKIKAKQSVNRNSNFIRGNISNSKNWKIYN